VTLFRANDWHRVELIVFDVDGTLYEQRRLRAAMAAEMLIESLKRFDLRLVRTIAKYRALKERLADAEVRDFEARLSSQLRAYSGLSALSIDAWIGEWIERRPLRHLAKCRYPRVEELFVHARRSGKRIAVLSDYPADAKLCALGLAADIVVAARDPEVGVQKPHPAGLLRVLELAGTDPDRALMIGDRADRDGAAARRAGVPVLIRSSKPLVGWQTFHRYDDPIFSLLLAS
jgi:putative hydrolase of the HAD superfamily